MSTRIYIVTSDSKEFLVEASNASQALRTVVNEQYKVRPAKTKELADKMRAGLPLITATSTKLGTEIGNAATAN